MTALTVPDWTQADRLRKAREITGLDQSQFAARIDVSRQTVSNYETGAVHPRRIVLRAWARASGVPLEWLENGDSPARTGKRELVAA